MHLCSPTQTYQVRQVSTSNSLFVTAPATLQDQGSVANGHNGETDAASEDDEVARSPTGALSAIGQVSSVLELQAVQLDVRALLRGVVPVWHWNDTAMTDRAGRAVSKREIFDQIPAPDGRIEHAWRELFAFQLQGRGYVPDHETLCQAWRQVMHRFEIVDGGKGAVLGAKNFLHGGNTCEDDLNDGERELLDEVRSAIWWSPLLRKPTEKAAGQDEDGELDQEATAAWVGKLVLSHMASGDKVVDAEQFMIAWRNLLPEQWGSGIGFDSVDQERYQLETNVDGVNMIRWTGGEPGRAVDGIPREKGGLESVAKDSKPAAGTVGKRKWHEKFKDSRTVRK